MYPVEIGNTLSATLQKCMELNNFQYTVDLIQSAMVLILFLAVLFVLAYFFRKNMQMEFEKEINRKIQRAFSDMNSFGNGVYFCPSEKDIERIVQEYKEYKKAELDEKKVHE
jgi:hypothetical protein